MSIRMSGESLGNSQFLFSGIVIITNLQQKEGRKEARCQAGKPQPARICVFSEKNLHSVRFSP